MSRFRNELSVVPGAAWVVAWILSAVFALGIGEFLGIRHRAELLPFGLTLIVPALLMGVFVLLIGYVYGDAKRRGMRYVVWTLLAIFIPNALGILLYFLLREPLHPPCLSCGAPLRAGFTYCSACGASAGRACPQCNRAVEEGWRNCAHCGVVLVS